MQTSHSLSSSGCALKPTVDHNKIFRASILNATPIPAQTIAVLEARGVNVGELETRVRQSLECRR